MWTCGQCQNLLVMIHSPQSTSWAEGDAHKRPARTILKSYAVRASTSFKHKHIAFIAYIFYTEPREHDIETIMFHSIYRNKRIWMKLSTQPTHLVFIPSTLLILEIMRFEIIHVYNESCLINSNTFHMSTCWRRINYSIYKSSIRIK